MKLLVFSTYTSFQCTLVDSNSESTRCDKHVMRALSSRVSLIDAADARQAPGETTPQGRPGLLGHEAQDVKTFCGANNLQSADE